MSLKNRLVACLMVFALFVVGAGVAHAQAYLHTPSARIESYLVGWGEKTALVRFANVSGSSMTNPAGCGTTDGWYSTSATDTGADFYQSALLAAYLSGRPVSLVINGCVGGQGGRPRLIAVTVGH